MQITYDPRKITYGRILQVYFSVAHDPTELNRQGPDSGTQYRSAIFPLNDEQAQVAKAYIAQLDAAHVFGAPVVTTIEPGKTFYRAEDYHQDFLAKNPAYPYIVYNDLPKVANLKRLFPALYRPDPDAGQRRPLVRSGTHRHSDPRDLVLRSAEGASRRTRRQRTSASANWIILRDARCAGSSG